MSQPYGDMAARYLIANEMKLLKAVEPLTVLRRFGGERPELNRRQRLFKWFMIKILRRDNPYPPTFPPLPKGGDTIKFRRLNPFFTYKTRRLADSPGDWETTLKSLQPVPDGFKIVSRYVLTSDKPTEGGEVGGSRSSSPPNDSVCTEQPTERGDSPVDHADGRLSPRSVIEVKGQAPIHLMDTRGTSWR